jgi:transglutaminase-like putative cysteine protease
MKLKIIHRTEYHYEKPVRYSIQELRLSPFTQPGQIVQHWKIKAPAKLIQNQDAFDNKSSIFTLDSPYSEMVIEAEGEIRTSGNSIFMDNKNSVSPYYLLQTTKLTESSPEMVHFFKADLPSDTTHKNLLKLANAIRKAIPYTPGKTHFDTTALQTFAIRAGVCQDHAHMMLSLCRASNIPARYVSGYFFAENSPNLASHAWVDVCTDISNGKWLSLDITHACLTDERHIRVAIGRDYYSAAPIKGIRSGGGDETLSARISIQEIT